MSKNMYSGELQNDHCRSDARNRSDRPIRSRLSGHPKGLGYLAFVEGCERFSYYSMQTLLVLYMVKYLLLPENAAGVIGLDWMKGWYGLDGQPLASKLFGDYTSLVYLDAHSRRI
jgi:POT family proton-dependent oligopeptide transporter